MTNPNEVNFKHSITSVNVEKIMKNPAHRIAKLISTLHKYASKLLDVMAIPLKRVLVS